MTPHRRQLLQDAIRLPHSHEEGERKLADSAVAVVADPARKRDVIHVRQAAALQAKLDDARSP